MKAIGVITLIITLLAQAMPLSLSANGKAKPECGMSCCCHSGASPCSCAESPGTTEPMSPVNVPSVKGTELVPQIVWIASTLFLHQESVSDESMSWRNERLLDSGPSVRLPVLFCSILI